MGNNQITAMLKAMSEMYGRQMSPQAATIMTMDLANYREEDVLNALKKCRLELRTFPTVGDIVSRIQAQDGRPGVEEAWSLCPLNEMQSTVWTEEVRDAFCQAALPLVERDPIAARMAFKEKYQSLLNEARTSGRKVKWEASLGQDKIDREKTLMIAIQKGRLNAEEARLLLPDISFSEKRTTSQIPALEGKTSKGLTCK